MSIRSSALRMASIAVASTLIGCGSGDLSKGSLGKIIDDDLVETNQPECWSLKEKPTSLPVNVGFGFFSSPQQNPILKGLGEAGYITARRDPSSRSGNTWVIDMTDEGRKAGVWDEQNGFCVGRKRLHEVIRWTEPAAASGATITTVTYTWMLKDGPKWVKPDMFPDIDGIAEPVEREMVLVKTSDGWRSAD